MKRRKIAVWVLMLVLAFAGTGLGDLSEGLVAYYPFNGHANDESGNGNDGVVHGATPVVDRLGNPNSAYSFDGQDDYVQAAADAATILDSGSSLTVSLWVKMFDVSGGTDGTQRIVGSELLNDGFLLQTYSVDSKLKMAAGTGTGNAQYSAGIPIEVDRWYHVAMTFDEGTERWEMSVDGDLRDTIQQQDWGWSAGTRQLIIGGDDNDTGVGVNCFVHGIIDEVRIYSRALEAPEIAVLAGGTIDATVDIDPDTLNLDSKGKWVTCYIDLPDEYEVSDIDAESILLEGLLDVQRSDIQDGVLVVKFDREDLAAYIDVVLGVVPPVEVELVVMGTLTDGTPFEGRDTIRVIDEGGGN